MTPDTEHIGAGTPTKVPRILFCNCTYANVVPPQVKQDVLAALSAAGVAFDAVPDLCDMAARKDPALARLSEASELRVAACYERAVRWLFHSTGHELPAEGVAIHNMREGDAADIARALLAPCGSRP